MNKYQSFQKIVNFIFLLLKEVQSLTEQEVNDIIEGSVTVKLALHPKYSKQLNTQIKTTISKEVSSTEKDTNSVDELEASSIETEISSTEGLELKSEQLKSEQLKSEQLKIEQSVDIAKLSPEQVAETLRSLDTREEGLRILTDFCSARKDLQSLAIHIDIPNSRRDSIPTLREKIIEATIGYRLRSRAIQGEPIEKKWLPTQTPESDLVEATQDETISTSTKELDVETLQESQPDPIEQTHLDPNPDASDRPTGRS
ncbi:hypothetical protein [Nostoc sp. 'Peltigera membranacea cyanobiont' 232]|uniref:hypothetical protein n=1 Tax=Nostoc sp. 'Peltigera membranacea cyanobiont' 232 TaxID=2014531 RepID=UPI000B95B215|nr:hypothetical protein [Nostoc sp. 'Peltigera membranacea cyanobiont' 232]OYE00007.1 hypothetical protein CDG79_37620 [Nostoc sp. 'Peltigera membranacea cyanobiont' 232]